MALPFNPLNEQHLQLLNQILRTYHEPMAVIQACKDCGVPVDELEAQLNQMVDMARKLKATFFPHEP